jgi:rhodanese-related sulfurtransferase
MPSNTEITVSQLVKLVGLPNAPAVFDVREEADFNADPYLVPGAMRCLERGPTGWPAVTPGRGVVLVCRDGGALSQGLGAMLRQSGTGSETLEGGFDAWRAARALAVKAALIPERNERGRTVWVTRARPKIDRIACPWLIRRFIDPLAEFLFVSAGEVNTVAERFKATPFDIDGVFWTHRAERCSFDTMIEEFGLRNEALDRLAAIVRAADTDRLETMPQAAGLLAVSLGLSRMYKDDLEQLEAGFVLYDALYRWSRDAVNETHDWPAHSPMRTQ